MGELNAKESSHLSEVLDVYRIVAVKSSSQVNL